MQVFVDVLNQFEPYIIVTLSVLIIILLIMVIMLFSSLGKLENRYRKFMRGTDGKNIEEVIIKYLDKIDEANDKTEYMNEKYKDLDARIKGCVQKVSMVRYRAFEDVGSDLSFSIAMLDDNNDGVIVTGIYGRNDSTTYAKPIDKGLSRYELSDEEQKVLQDAMIK